MSGLMSDQKKMEGRNYHFLFIYGNWTKLDVLDDMSAVFSDRYVLTVWTQNINLSETQKISITFSLQGETKQQKPSFKVHSVLTKIQYSFWNNYNTNTHVPYLKVPISYVIVTATFLPILIQYSLYTRYLL